MLAGYLLSFLLGRYLKSGMAASHGNTVFHHLSHRPTVYRRPHLLFLGPHDSPWSVLSALSVASSLPSAAGSKASHPTDPFRACLGRQREKARSRQLITKPELGPGAQCPSGSHPDKCTAPRWDPQASPCSSFPLWMAPPSPRPTSDADPLLA